MVLILASRGRVCRAGKAEQDFFWNPELTSQDPAQSDEHFFVRASFQEDSSSGVVTHAHSQNFDFVIVSRRKSCTDDHGNVGWIPGLEMLERRGAAVVTIQIKIQEYQVRGRCLVDFFERAGERKDGRDLDRNCAQLGRVCLDIFGKSNAKDFVVIDP